LGTEVDFGLQVRESVSAQIGEPSDSSFGVRAIVTESPQVGTNPKEKDEPLEQITDAALLGWHEVDFNPTEFNTIDRKLAPSRSKLLD
jgi:hypothetical protein